MNECHLIKVFMRDFSKLVFLFDFVVLSHPCFKQYFDEIKGQFFIQGETDKGLGRLAFVLMLAFPGQRMTVLPVTKMH